MSVSTIKADKWIWQVIQKNLEDLYNGWRIQKQIPRLWMTVKLAKIPNDTFDRWKCTERIYLNQLDRLKHGQESVKSILCFFLLLGLVDY